MVVATIQQVVAILKIYFHKQNYAILKLQRTKAFQTLMEAFKF